MDDTMDASSVIAVEGLWRRYGGAGGRGFDAVRGVSFHVRRGELFALLGTNGAGKTSTLEVLEGLAPPTSGRVRVLGHDPRRARRRVRPRIGIMLQDGAFPADLTVAETVRAWAGTLTSPRPVAEALDLADLSDRAGVRLRQLSGGERRRLDLAVAILGRPEVLFLDEPTTGLDPEGRRGTWRLVARLLESGTSVLLTTHYLEEADALADRLAIMHHGRIVRSGTPAEVAASQPSRISFALPADAREPVPDLPGTIPARPCAAVDGHGRGDGRGDGRGGGTVLATDDLQQTLTALLDWARRHDVRLHDLNARSASLEEAFLAVAAADGHQSDDQQSDGHQPDGQQSDDRAEVAA